MEKYVQNCKHAFVDRKDAIGKKKLGIAEANKEAAVKKQLKMLLHFQIKKKYFLERVF